VTYHKSDEIGNSTNYNDHFISPSIFAWESRSNRRLESSEIQNVIDSKRILLFVKKEDAEGTDFYFVGDVSIIDGSVTQEVMRDTEEPVVHFKFQLEQPVTDNLYNYITATKHKELPEATPRRELADAKPIKISRPRFTIPLFDFYAAAGSFDELQSETTYSLIEVDKKYALDDQYFACKVVGESMNKRIPNGSICIFKKYAGGSRNGKIVLVENRDTQDLDFCSAFTVKTYFSQKALSGDGRHNEEIILKPNSYNERYKDIVVTEEQADGMRVIGEFVCVL